MSDTQPSSFFDDFIGMFSRLAEGTPLQGVITKLPELVSLFDGSEGESNHPLVASGNLSQIATLNQGVMKPLELSFEAIQGRCHNMEESLSPNFEVEGELGKFFTDIDRLGGGNRTLNAINKKANIMGGRFESVLEGYNHACSVVAQEAADFMVLRADVQGVFFHYADTLLSIFGDKIKIALPELFDFSKIETLDTGTMRANLYSLLSSVTGFVDLKLSEHAKISKAYNEKMNFASDLYYSGSKVGRKAGTAIAILESISNLAAAESMNKQAEAQLSNLRRTLANYMASIKGDLPRLSIIMQTLRDSYIPQAINVLQRGTSSLDDTYRSLLTAIFGSKDEAMRFYDKRLQLIANIADCDYSVDRLDDAIKAMQVKWDDANKYFQTYEHRVIERAYKAKAYRDAVKDRIKIAEKQKEAEKKEKAKYVAEFAATSNYLKERVNDGGIMNDSNFRNEVVTMISLVAVAKRVLSLGLDNKLTKPQEVQQFLAQPLLPDEVRSDIDYCITELQSRIKRPIPVDENGNVQQDNLEATVNMSFNEMVDNLADLGRSTLMLQEQLNAEKLAIEDYDRQLAEIQKSYADLAAKANIQSETMLKVAAQLDAAKNPKEVKEAFLAMSGGSLNISDKEWNDFFSGNGSISI